jgi:dTDP-4-amino-4,6-dideoxygalactose transaminase
MSEIVAAYALIALKNLQSEKLEWAKPQELSRSLMMNSKFGNCTSSFEGFNPYWIAQFGSEEQCINAEVLLAKNQVATRRWWPKPISGMPAFQKIEKISYGSNAHELANCTLGLPMWRNLPTTSVTKIAKLLESVG